MAKLNSVKAQDLWAVAALHWGKCEEEPLILPRTRTMHLKPTVYALLQKDTTIAYVGHTSCLARRMGQHKNDPKKEKLKWTQVAIFSPQIISLHTRLQVEAMLIAAFVPIGNQVISLRRTINMIWREVRFRGRR